MKKFMPFNQVALDNLLFLVIIIGVKSKQIAGWQQQAGSLKQVSIDHGGRMVGVDVNDNIWTKPFNPYEGWIIIPGLLSHVSIRGNMVVGIGGPLRETSYIQTTIFNDWIVLEGSFKQISIDSTGVIFGLTGNYQLFYKLNYAAPWQLLYGSGIQGDISNGKLIVINEFNELFYKSTLLSNWISISVGQIYFKYASINERGHICAVDLNENIYYMENPPTGEWVQLPGQLKQIDCKDYYIIGVDSANQIWTTYLI